jgi:hypothetical protein
MRKIISNVLSKNVRAQHIFKPRKFVAPAAVKHKGKIVNKSSLSRTPPRAVRVTKHEVATPDSKYVFFSGGIGDVFALESYMTDSMRANLRAIYYGTRQYKPIQEAFSKLGNYPNLIKQHPVWTDFGSFWAFYSKTDCIRRMKSQHVIVDKEFFESADWSISKIFEEIKRGKRKYNGCSFLKGVMADISHLKLPQEYVVICPYSTDKRLVSRDFSKKDWNVVENYLSKTGRIGVVLNKGDYAVPESSRWINMSNKTSICESIEILKKARFYIGIDSCMCILAARHFYPANLFVKSVNKQFYNCQSIYCAPNNVRVLDRIEPMELDANPMAPYLLNQRGRQAIGCP